MATHFVKTDAQVSRVGLRLVACVIFAGCIGIVLMIPTPVAPRELPPLVIRHDVDHALLARTRSLAARAPSDASARALDAFVAAAGRRELHRVATDAELASEELDVVALRTSMVARNGRASIAAMRARAVLAFLDVFEPGRVPDRAHAGIVGSFGASLDRWGVVHDRKLVAPALVLRVLYAARWNVVVRLPPTSGMGREELRAYHGWLALHAPDVPRDMRRVALVEFAGVSDGDDAAEAIATVEFVEDDLGPASASYDRMLRSGTNLRLRNTALATHLLMR